jgi:hypothetical protein
MGQQDTDTACAPRPNPLTCRVLLHDTMGQQLAITDDFEDFCILTFNNYTNPTRFNPQACLSNSGLMG